MTNIILRDIVVNCDNGDNHDAFKFCFGNRCSFFFLFFRGFSVLFMWYMYVDLDNIIKSKNN